MAHEPPEASRDELPGPFTERDVLAQAEAISHIGSWALDVQTGLVWWSDET